MLKADSRTMMVTNTLQRPTLHRVWVEEYESSENQQFYDMAFDYVAKRLHRRPGATVLDAGCGSCGHAMRLADRGFTVHAVDFSAPVVESSRRLVEQRGYGDRVDVQRENLLALSFADNSFENVMCWGVLMHIPKVEQALTELVRVLAPGGRLVIGEGNAGALQAGVVRGVKKVLGRERALIERRPAGIEYWKQTDDGLLLTRQADPSWLIASMARQGLVLRERRAAQFTEAYVRLPWAVARRTVHAVNALWFRHVRVPGPAFGQLFIFEKRRTAGRISSTWERAVPLPYTEVGVHAATG